jgi:superfamily I DNA/RNA helicase
MKLNDEQQAAVDSKAPMILCLAGAGTGKTETMVSRVVRLVDEGVSPDAILVLTFTNAAAAEMTARYRRKCSYGRIPQFATFHAFCYRLITIDERIRTSLGYKDVPTVADGVMLEHLQDSVRAELGITLSMGKLTGKLTLSPKDQFQYDLFQKEFSKQLRRRDIITFDIMCYEVCKLFEEDSELIQLYKQQLEYIFVDEFQDTDPRQWKFVASIPCNAFVVGDAKQCQPAGTQITMCDGSIKPIEELKIGDYVLSYNVDTRTFGTKPYPRYAKRIMNIEHHEADSIITLKAGNYTTQYTPEHITYVRMHKAGNENKKVVYLMRNSQGWYRVGHTTLYWKSNGFSLSGRLKQEAGTDIWLLKVVESDRDAWIEEQLVSYKFGIPQTCWELEVTRYDKAALDYLYSQMPDIHDKAIKCLAEYGRYEQYPFTSFSGRKTSLSQFYMFEINACNLIPEIMDCVIPEKHDRKLPKSTYNASWLHYPDWHITYRPIDSIVLEPQKREVYSLDIEVNHNYVADGLLTHNCIYQFRGSDSSIIKFLAESDDWKTFPLSYNYRSTQQLCDFANTIHKQWKGSAYDLKIRSGRQGRGPILVRQDDNYIQKIDMLLNKHEGETIAVLARTNAEVNYLKQNLMSESVTDRVTSSNAEKAYHLLNSALSDEYFISWASSSLSGNTYRDWMRVLTLIGPDINKIIETIPNSQFILRDWKLVQRIRDYMKDPNLLPFQKAMDIADLVNLNVRMLEISEDTPEAIVDCITSSIELPPKSKVHVGTIHSAKGLEYDVVILVGVNGKSFQLTSEEMINLYYVGVTRAKTSLYIMKVED